MNTDFIYDLMYRSLEFIENNKIILTAIFSGSIGGLLFLGIVPLTTKEDATTGEVFSALTRRALLLTLFIFLPLILLYVYFFSTKLTGNSDYFRYFFKETIYGFRGSWALYVAILAGTLTFKFSMERIIEPYLSYLIRKYRVRQSSEKLSDIRSEFGRLKSKNYDPRKYFKDGYMFLGLDEDNKPIYETDEDFKTRHIKFIGPTQTGKGVIQGLIIYQSILKGWCVGFFDIKPDDFIYSIMCKACKEAGRPLPVVVDLNGAGPGSYNMFTNGTSRDIVSRIQAAVNVIDKGTSADFYSAEERALMIDIEEHFDGSLKTLEQLLLGKMPNGESRPEYYDMTKKSRAYVKEMKGHKPINPKKGRGFNVDKTLKANAVFYIRGSITDKLIKKAQTIMLMDIIQSVIRLGKRDTHFYLAIDEVKFIVSDMLSTGLSTVLSKGMNMSVAYQTPSNLLNLEDSTLNAKAIKSEIEVNTLTTLSYRAADDETAEWAAGLTGTRNKSVIRSEGVDYGRMGAEKYTGQKQMHQEQEELIPMNRMKALPIRAGALMRPNCLAVVLFTCWIPLNAEEFIDIVKEPNKNKEATDGEDDESTHTLGAEAQINPVKHQQTTQGGKDDNTITLAADAQVKRDDDSAKEEGAIIVYGRERKAEKPHNESSRMASTDKSNDDYSLKDFLKEAGIK